MEIITVIALLFVGTGMFLVPVLFVGRMVCAIFLPTSREAVKRKKVLHIVWFLFSAFIAFCVLDPGPGNGLQAARRAKTHVLEEQIRTAILAYQTEYNTPPPGKDNATLIKELESDNSRGIAFINLRTTDKNAKGEILDAWGIPLQINMTDPSHPVIRSSAPAKFGVDIPDENSNTTNKSSGSPGHS